jgi:hypothetical protein
MIGQLKSSKVGIKGTYEYGFLLSLAKKELGYLPIFFFMLLLIGER